MTRKKGKLLATGVKAKGDYCPQKAIRFAKIDNFFVTGEKNPNARYRNEHVSLMDLKRANNQRR